MNIKLKDLPKTKKKPHPILEGLPEELKNHHKFLEIEKNLAQFLISSHKHKTPASYIKCEECQKRRTDRQEAIKALGFKSFQQYLEWKKIMVVIQSGGLVI